MLAPVYYKFPWGVNGYHLIALRIRTPAVGFQGPVYWLDTETETEVRVHMCRSCVQILGKPRGMCLRMTS